MKNGSAIQMEILGQGLQWGPDQDDIEVHFTPLYSWSMDSSLTRRDPIHKAGHWQAFRSRICHRSPVCRFPVLRSWWSVIMISVLSAGLSCASGHYTTVIWEIMPNSASNHLSSIYQTIQQAAFHAFKHPKTGKIFNATVPTLVGNVTIQTVRLRTRKLKNRGFILGEFNIPIGCEVDGPHLVRVVLVYQNFGNLSVFSPPIGGQELVSPVLGIMAYDGSNLNATGPLPPLNVFVTADPIRVTIPFNSPTSPTEPLFCASYSISGAANTSGLSLMPNTCSFTHLGNFALIGEAPTPAPAPSPVLSVASKHRSNAWKIAVVSVLGVVLFMVILSLLTMVALHYRQKQWFAKLQYHAEHGETHIRL